MNKLSNKFIEKLKLIPETGMGYHKVKAVLINNEEKLITILNCSIIEDNINPLDIIDIQEVN
jgi:hypothetical protein